LIDAFSRKRGGAVRYLEGRVKLAKLDFLLRYPAHLKTVLAARGVAPSQFTNLDTNGSPLENRMVRYRYGPWDPAYYAILGSLIGRGLIEVAPLPGRSGLGYRTTRLGERVVKELVDDGSFSEMAATLELLRRHLDKSGTTLKNYLYELPEVSDASWHEELT
jgi:hypothetical protein